MFNYNHLYYFYITAKLGSVTLAGQHLRTSQSSLSSQLKTLEATLERNLFEKVGRRLQLTHDGQQVFDYCRRAFEVTDELAEYLSDSTGTKTHRVLIGVTDEIERPFITDLLSRVLGRIAVKDRPMIRMFSMNHPGLYSKMSVDELDYGISNQPISSEGISLIREISVPVVLVGSPGLLRGDRKLSNSATILKSIDLGLVLPPPEFRIRHEIDSFLHKNKIKKKISFESNIFSTLTRAITDGIGVGFLPLPFVTRELTENHIEIYGPRLWEHKLFLFAKARHAQDQFTTELSRQLGAAVANPKRSVSSSDDNVSAHGG